MLKLTCTANDLRPLAEAAGFDPPVHKWNPAERVELLAELDAGFLHLYGIGRDEVEYLLGTFQGLRSQQEGVSLTPEGKAIVEAYERLS